MPRSRRAWWSASRAATPEPTNTIGSPSTDPLVLSVGASTQFQFYAQTNYAAARLLRDDRLARQQPQLAELRRVQRDRWHRQPGRPGRSELRLLRRELPIFYGCINFLGQPPIIEESGGTSESSPFVAGAAALVIQAYRQTHGGASPTPALVKQILVSTATDLGAPGQRAGRGPAELLQGRAARRVHSHRRWLAAAGRQHAAALHESAERGRRIPAPRELDRDRHQHRRVPAGREPQRPDLRAGPERADRQRHAERRARARSSRTTRGCRTTTQSSTSRSRRAPTGWTPRSPTPATRRTGTTRGCG